MTENSYPRAEDDAERALYDIECLCRVGVAASNTTLDANSLLFSMDTLFEAIVNRAREGGTLLEAERKAKLAAKAST